MTSGDKINIPDEGWCKLIELIDSFESGWQIWLVEFDDCPDKYFERLIKT